MKTTVTRKRSQLEKLSETNSDFAKLPLAAKVLALLLFPGIWIAATVWYLTPWH